MTVSFGYLSWKSRNTEGQNDLLKEARFYGNNEKT